MAQDGKLQKLMIRAFSDPKFESELFLTDDKKPYEVAINPESYSLNFKSEYAIENASGSSKGGVKFHRSLPENLTLDFLFDRTGVFKDSPPQENGVIDDIKEFKKITYEFNGDIHSPNYLKVSWGDLLFQCVVTELNIEYKLFNSNGKPIRANVKTTLKNTVAEAERAAREKKSSPDLTHYRIVKEGDNLPLMTHRIYGDPKYYLEVARVNGLTNFRKLTPGQKIVFPPIEKTT
ncbi:MAG: LysM peptidoglycan-binding domain-containing protein [Flavobacteriales bacterium]|nr:LysM peptidoglycan-binding domain-containing protein [Flavobacteriales bacterium]